MELIGILKAVTPALSGVSSQGNEWKKITFVVTYQEEGSNGATYDYDAPFTLFGKDKVDNFKYNIGDKLKVLFDIRGREWQGKWYPDLSAYKTELFEANPQAAQQAPSQQPTEATATASQAPAAQPTQTEEANADDLPF